MLLSNTSQSSIRSAAHKSCRDTTVRFLIANPYVHLHPSFSPHKFFIKSKVNATMHVNGRKCSPFRGNSTPRNIALEKLKHNLKVCHLVREYSNYKMTTTDEIQRLPEEAEIIIATVREVTGHGVYV